ncbi:GNAT family N-acetyltransferase [Paenibacillus abyssi]|uniref:N-acetyltransferase n=1 Tax=Paenibacillus abyssi TaxID=1340531 RepID=A0A917FZ79_9BACL|nr:GNAT family N-acetyltransferase [Paenibacillus abyssi]GGG14981.1 N-acetyltransferase [Paenibacillus abyssi]
MEMMKVEMRDFRSILKIFREVKMELEKQNNDQWKWIYPNRFIYKADVKNGTMYGIKEGNEYIAVVTLDNRQSNEHQSMKWRDHAGTPCCIHRLAVRPDRQGKGLGKQLLRSAEHLAKQQGYTSVRIDVYQSNATAISLYEKNGYLRIGEVRYPMRKLPYVTMEKQLLHD